MYPFPPVCGDEDSNNRDGMGMSPSLREPVHRGGRGTGMSDSSLQQILNNGVSAQESRTEAEMPYSQMHHKSMHPHTDALSCVC